MRRTVLRTVRAGAPIGRRERSVGEDFRQQPTKRRPGFEQPEEVHAARQALDDVTEPVERAVRIGTRRDRPQQARQHRLKSLLGWRRPQRTRLAGSPVGDVARRACRIAESQRAELFGEDVGVVRQLRCRLRSEAIEDHAGPFDVRPQQAEQGIATVQPMQLRDIVERRDLHRQHVRLRIVNHLHAMLDCPQKAVGFAELARSALVEALRREEVSQSVECRRGPDGGITAAVDHLLDLHEEFDLANPAAPALQIIPRADVAHLAQNGRGSAPRSGGLPRSPRNRASGARRRVGSHRGIADRAHGRRRRHGRG